MSFLGLGSVPNYLFSKGIFFFVVGSSQISLLSSKHCWWSHNCSFLAKESSFHTVTFRQTPFSLDDFLKGRLSGFDVKTKEPLIPLPLGRVEAQHNSAKLCYWITPTLEYTQCRWESKTHRRLFLLPSSGKLIEGLAPDFDVVLGFGTQLRLKQFSFKVLNELWLVHICWKRAKTLHS